MNRFGMPLVPSALALSTSTSATASSSTSSAPRATCVYSIGVRIASALVLLNFAFRTAWPAFAYSIEDDAEARRTYAFVLTYLVVVTSWLALAVSCSPWLVRLLTTPQFYEDRVVAPLAFAAVALAPTRWWRSASGAFAARSSTGW